jgi:hypothetical protein
MTTAIAPRNGHAPVARAKQSALIEVFQVLHVGVGFRVTPETERAFELILSGYEPDVLRFAALEYVRQRKVAPDNAGALGQLAGWLQRAIEDERPKYKPSERRAERDTFVAQFVAACGADTRRFIADKANAPRATEPVAEMDEDRADLLRRIELTKTRLARNGFVDADYGRAYLAHLEAQL